jgi:hypothetical protein
MDLKPRPRPLAERNENHSVPAASPSSDEKCPVSCQLADETTPRDLSIAGTPDPTEICRSPRAIEEEDGEGSNFGIEREPSQRRGHQNQLAGDENPSVPCQVTAESEQSDVFLPATQDPKQTCHAPTPLTRPVALRRRMIPGHGYEPENEEWFEALTEKGNRHRPVGRDPMWIPPEVLTMAGHGPRRTRAIVKALGEEPIAHEIRRHSDLCKHCLDCSSGSKVEVRQCAIIDCPLWPYRMGRNPHNPRRGRNPFAKKIAPRAKP